MSRWSWGGFDPKPTVAERKAEAAAHLAAAAKRGKALAPVVIDGRGRAIARSVWGKAWCDNLERYRDFAHRLERGRSYVRSGAVVDLTIADGLVTAQVLGSSLYRVKVTIAVIEPARWRAIQRDCTGSIGSLVDLLAGSLSPAVMQRLCAPDTGMFPEPRAIAFQCSCPDVASMCKHVAATLYGVGARLDHEPALLFTLRHASVDELLAAAVADAPVAAPISKRALTVDAGLGALFGIDLAAPAAAPPPSPKPAPARRAATKATATPKATAKTKATATPAPPAKVPAKRTATKANAKTATKAKPAPTRRARAPRP